MLGLLVRGDDVDSFLTPSAVSTVFSTWHALASSRSDTELLALVGGLELCLFTRALWKGDAEAVAVEQLLDVVECVYAAARLSREVSLLKIGVDLEMVHSASAASAAPLSACFIWLLRQ